ncbi:MAG: hypothetical protein QX190_01710 [Methylococcales bacterium]
MIRYWLPNVQVISPDELRHSLLQGLRERCRVRCAYLSMINGTHSVTAIKLRIFPFALSLSKGEWKNSSPEVKTFMLRQAQHERLNLMSLKRSLGTRYSAVFIS